MIHELSFPKTPPSFNTVGSRGGKLAFHREKKRWQEQMEIALMAEGVPRGMKFVKAHALLRFTDARRRDVVNYRTIIEKALGDALVNGGWISDDTSDQFQFGVVQMHKAKKEETIVYLECEET